MKGYTIDTSWDDPFDHPVERRSAQRFDIKMKMTITAQDPERLAVAVGPGNVRNLSLSGARVVTKHQLHPFQRVHLEMPTGLCTSNVCLPGLFEGSAQVVRVDDIDGTKSLVALKFGDEFLQNMEFVIFIDLLQAMSRVMVTSPRVA